MANSDDNYSDVEILQGPTSQPHVDPPDDNDFSLGSGSPLDSVNYDSSAHAQRPSRRVDTIIRNYESLPIPLSSTPAPRSAFVTAPAPQPAAIGKGKKKPDKKDRSTSFDSTGRHTDGNRSSSGPEGRKSSSSDAAKSQGKKKKPKPATAATATTAGADAPATKPKKKRAPQPPPAEPTAHANDDPSASDNTVRRSARAPQPTNFFSPDDLPPRPQAPAATAVPARAVDLTADHSSENEDPPSHDERVTGDPPPHQHASPAHEFSDRSRNFESRFTAAPQNARPPREYRRDCHRDSRDRYRDDRRRDHRDHRDYHTSSPPRGRRRHRSNSRSSHDSDRSRRRYRSRSRTSSRDSYDPHGYRSRSHSPHREHTAASPAPTRSSARIAEASTQRRTDTADPTRYNPDNPSYTFQVIRITRF